MSVSGPYIWKASYVDKFWYKKQINVQLTRSTPPFIIRKAHDGEIPFITKTENDTYQITMKNKLDITPRERQTTQSNILNLLWKHKVINIFYDNQTELEINEINMKHITYITNITIECPECENKRPKNTLLAQKWILVKETDSYECWKHTHCV